MSQPERITAPTVTCTCECGASYESIAWSVGDKVHLIQHSCDACYARRRAEREAKTAEQRVADRRHSERHAAEQAAARLAERVTQLLAELDVPALYAACSFDTFALHGTPVNRQVQRAALGYARRYATAFPDVAMTVVFQGEPGSGKGHVAWSLCRAVVAAGHSARNVKLSDLVRDLRASWGKSGDDAGDAALRRVRAADLLVIDEVSSHAFYGQPVQHLYDVLDHRLERQRPTILTSNETDGGLRALLGPALWNRIEGHGGVVDFGTASWRSRA